MKRNDKVILFYKDGRYEVREMEQWKQNDLKWKEIALFLFPFFGQDPLYIPVRPSAYLFATQYEVLLEPRMFYVDIEGTDLVEYPMREEHKVFPGTSLGVVEFINYLYVVYKMDAFADLTTSWDLPDDCSIGFFYDIAKMGIRIFDGKTELFNKFQKVDLLTYEEFEIDGYIVSIDNYKSMLDFLILDSVNMLSDGETFTQTAGLYPGYTLTNKHQTLFELANDHYHSVSEASIHRIPYLYPIIGLNTYYLTDLEELEFLSSLEVPNSFLVHTFNEFAYMDDEDRRCFSSQETLSERVGLMNALQVHSFAPTHEYHFIYFGCFLPYYCEYMRGAVFHLLFFEDGNPDDYPVVVSLTGQSPERSFAYLDKQVQSFQQLKPILKYVLGGTDDVTETD